MKSELVIFITHNFLPNFIHQLQQFDNDNDRQIIVLYDSINLPINVKFKYIEIIPMQRINSTYDNTGHTMYISFFRQNEYILSQFKNIWIIENDVHFQCGIDYFIRKHKDYNYDVLVPEYGLRCENWYHTKTLRGFEHVSNIGVLMPLIRFSNKFLSHLIQNIDKNYFGFMEAIIPHICIKYNYTIATFLPDLLGVMNVYGGPLIELIKKDIVNNTEYVIEDKVYHPIKL